MSEFVVAGATGRVGSAVTRCLLERGHSVIALTRSPERGVTLEAIGASVAVATLGNAHGLAAVLHGADGFFVLLPEPMDATDFHAERRTMVRAIADAVAASDVSRVVALSSLGAQFANGMGPITDLHYFEQALRTSGKPLTIVRAATFQDNVASLVELASQSGIFPNFQPERDVAISMVAIRDVAEIVANRLAQPATGDVVDVLGPWYSPRQVSEILGRVIGRSLEMVEIPAEGRVAAFCRAGLPKPFAEVLAELQQAIAARRIVPAGNQRDTGTTTLDETLATIARHANTR